MRIRPLPGFRVARAIAVFLLPLVLMILPFHHLILIFCSEVGADGSNRYVLRGAQPADVSRFQGFALHPGKLSRNTDIDLDPLERFDTTFCACTGACPGWCA